MASFNRVILVGNLTRDVELKHLPSGTAVSELGLAVNDRHKGANGEWVDETCFVDITLWGRTAEIASEYLQKGSSVLIEGRLKYSAWEKDGKKFSKLRVVGDRMQMLGSRPGGGTGGGGSGNGGGAASAGGSNSANSSSQPVRANSAVGAAGRSPAMPPPSSDFGGGFGSAGDEGSPSGGEDIPF
ncbi:MAG: single-stranded DNA-binding protein [Planctomycetota bacterium]